MQDYIAILTLNNFSFLFAMIRKLFKLTFMLYSILGKSNEKQ